MIRSEIEIRIVHRPTDDVLGDLFRELDIDLESRYPGEPVNGIDLERFHAAGGCLMLARLGSEDAGCGAFRPVDSATVEVKRMFVKSKYRRHGIAAAVLQALESEAKRRGFTRCILETGARMTEAIALYRRAGYARIECYGPYVTSARSVCFGKNL